MRWNPIEKKKLKAIIKKKFKLFYSKSSELFYRIAEVKFLRPFWGLRRMSCCVGLQQLMDELLTTIDHWMEIRYNDVSWGGHLQELSLG
jgi:hypothetical protein